MEHDKKILITSRQIKEIYQISKPADYTADPLWMYLKMRAPVAFQELFIPIISMAREQHFSFENERLFNRVSALPFISEAALRSMEYGLLELLSYVSSKVLETEFSVYRALYGSALARLLSGNNARELYNSFISAMYEGGFAGLLIEYPAMPDLFATVTCQWIETTIELISRLKKDFSAITEIFNNGINPGILKEIDSGLSDRHNGGRTVAVLTFDTGFKLVYKPRSLGMEKAWFGLLDELNKDQDFDFFKTIKTINHESYGWMEFVAHLPCSDENEIELYYRRAGALLCMVHCLRGTDCHYQNIIAHGAYPVLIDLETLFHPFSRELGINPVNSDGKTGDPERYYSVLRTGLLPAHAIKQDGKAYDLSGFGAGAEKNGYPKVLRWVNTNTDNMRQEYVKRDISKPANLPYLVNEPFNAKDFICELTGGFTEMYGYAAKSKKNFLSAAMLLKPFSKVKSRIVLRPTLDYFRLLQSYLEPGFLRNKESETPLLKPLPAGFTGSCAACSADEICKSEASSLSNLDFPYFFTETDGSFLCTSTGTCISNFLPLSGIAQAIKYITSMTESDLKRQIEYIKTSFL